MKKPGVTKQTVSVLQKLKRKPPERLDRTVQAIHEQVFGSIDCLTCAECCRHISPRLNHYDIERIARSLKIKPFEFEQRYLRRDQEGDYVFSSSPCPFLAFDNRCDIYNDRPQACKDYPHTDRRRFYQLIDLSIRNAEVCPGVAEVLELLANHPIAR